MVYHVPTAGRSEPNRAGTVMRTDLLCFDEMRIETCPPRTTGRLHPVGK